MDKLVCPICGEILKAELAITEPGWIIFHECIIRGNTAQEVKELFEKARRRRNNV